MSATKGGSLIKQISRVYVQQAIGVTLCFGIIAIVGLAIWSGIAPTPQTFVTMNVSSPSGFASPLDVINAHKPPLTELFAWAKGWQANWATSRPSSNEDLARLGDLIQQSGLGAGEQLSVGQYISGRGDKQVAAVWFRSGINQTEVEFDAAKRAGGASNLDAAEKVIRPLLSRGLDSADDLLGEPEMKDEHNLEKMLRMEMSLKRENQWDQRPEWVRIAHAESLFNLERYAEALNETTRLCDAVSHDKHFTDQEKDEIHWNMATVSFALEKYDRAAAVLEALAASRSFGHPKAVSRLLIDALCRAHRGLEAEAEFKEYMKRFHPDATEITVMSGTIEDAEYNEQYEKLHFGGGVTQ